MTSGVHVGQCSGQAKNDKQLSTNITLMIEQHQPHKKRRVNSCAPEVLAVPAQHVKPVVLLLNDTNIILHGNRAGHQYT